MFLTPVGNLDKCFKESILISMDLSCSKSLLISAKQKSKTVLSFSVFLQIELIILAYTSLV